MVNFPTQIPYCDSHSPALLDLFISSDAGICSTMAFLLLRNSDHVVVSVSIDVPSYSLWDALFHHIAYMTILKLIVMVFVIIWEMFHWRISLKSVLLLLLVNFVSGFRLELMYYIPCHRYQVKSHSSPWFSAAGATVIVLRNHFFCLYQQSKSSESKVKLRLASNWCKRILEPNELVYATKTKQSIISQKLRSWHLPIPLLFNGQELWSSASHKVKLSAKNFPRTLILMTQLSLYLLSLLDLIWN